MRVIVCGGRRYADEKAVQRVLDEVSPDEVLTGDATGADSLVRSWTAKNKPTALIVFGADWERFGRAAGPKRNEAMARFGADLCIAFPGGRGTADMVRRAHAHGIPVRIEG